jgi:hypothetical protein
MKRALALTALAVALCASVAEAHLGNSNYRDQINKVTPAVPGFSVQVLNFDNNLEIDNHTGKQVVISGYLGEPYARMLPNGTVQVNENSPAYYLNQDRYATAVVPPGATAKATPRWVTLDGTGRFEWHDHRIHFFSTATPSQVKNTSKTTKVFDWTVPISVGGQAGAIAGTLFWNGQTNAFPIWAVISLIVIVLAGAAIVVRARRRRMAGATADDEGGAPPPGDAPPPPGGDPPPPSRKVREAW